MSGFLDQYIILQQGEIEEVIFLKMRKKEEKLIASKKILSLFEDDIIRKLYQDFVESGIKLNDDA